MKKLTFKTLAVAALLSLVSTGAFGVDAGFGAAGAEGKTGLSLEQMLTYAIEDELLARAEYEAIIRRYGNIRPFANIARAEAQHIEWLKQAFITYGVEIPADAAGSRVAMPPDLRAAMETGVQAEIDNIAMYEAFLGAAPAEPLPADVRVVFERLKAASENHLRAFRYNLTR